MSLKEMSLQNYHYRRELSECQEVFSKWKEERMYQQSAIDNLMKEKEVYASEASLLRNETAAIRIGQRYCAGQVFNPN